jgi:hypothetical protein
LALFHLLACDSLGSAARHAVSLEECRPFLGLVIA